MSIFDKVTVVIPSYKPDEKLLSTLRGVIDIGFTDIIVVDDGGGEKYAPIFDSVKSIPQCTVLHHTVNRGKGAALKTAFAYYIDNRTDSLGLVTADADGQHLPEDILGCARAMEASASVVLGVRDFSQPHVPPRSKAGNRFTSRFFKIFFGMSISDTQTGLRAIPREYVKPISEVDGDRYEYETHMLFVIGKKSIPLSEHIINTVYIDDNSSSHFRVVRDSVRIYQTVLLFALSSILCTAIDIGALLGFRELFGFDSPIVDLALALLAARGVSAIVNYLFNYFAVFKMVASRLSLLKYLSVAAVILLISGSLAIVPELLSAPIWVSWAVKGIASLLLFPLSFRLQHNLVFNGRK